MSLSALEVEAAAASPHVAFLPCRARPPLPRQLVRSLQREGVMGGPQGSNWSLLATSPMLSLWPGGQGSPCIGNCDLLGQQQAGRD